MKKHIKRVKYFDIARGIAIILMIIGHVLGDGFKRNVIFSFHMPLFIIITGYFFKKEEKFTTFLIKTFKNVLFPYFMTIVLVNFINMFIKDISFIDIVKSTIKQLVFAYSYANKIQYNNIFPIGVLWFIPALVCGKVIFYIILNKMTDNPWKLGVLSYILLCIGLHLGTEGIWLPFSFDISLVFVFFIYIGYILKRFNVLEFILDSKSIIYSLFIIWIMGINFGKIELAVRSYPFGLTCVFTAISGTLCVFYISKIIERYFKGIGSILSWYGRNSMYILCSHYIEWELIQYTNINLLKNDTLKKEMLSFAKVAIITIITSLYLTVEELRDTLIRKKMWSEFCDKK